MGLIQAAATAVNATLSEQWKEFFYCDALPENVLMARGQKKLGNRHAGSNTKGDDNIISSGSVIAVADGQCMLIVEQGRVVELCAEPGAFTWDSSTEPSIFAGDLGSGLAATFQSIGRRFSFGGSSGKDQRVYYINTRELMGNKYGTASPVPFRVVDQNIGLDVDISVRCFGEYSYRIVDPILFYTNVCANVSSSFTREEIDSQLKSELLTALQPAFARISAMGIRYSAVPGHTAELADALNEELSEKWSRLRGIKIVAFGVNSLKALEEDEERIKQLQMNAALRNPTMAAATLTAAQAQAMQDAAKNQNAGPAMAFMGMNMANMAGGVNAAQLYSMGQQDQQGQPAQAAPTAPQGGFATAGAGAAAGASQSAAAAGGAAAQEAPRSTSPAGEETAQTAPQSTPAGEWSCPGCGSTNSGNFCTECGTKRPEKKAAFCPNCGHALNPDVRSNFCPECGTKLN